MAFVWLRDRGLCLIHDLVGDVEILSNKGDVHLHSVLGDTVKVCALSFLLLLLPNHLQLFFCFHVTLKESHFTGRNGACASVWVFCLSCSLAPNLSSACELFSCLSPLFLLADLCRKW